MTNKFPQLVGISLILSAILLIPSREFIQNNNLGFGLSYNDHILLGTLSAITFIIATYSLINQKGRKK